jgi:hypothetical protein
MTAIMIITVAPAMSKVSVEMQVPGVGTVGLGLTVKVGTTVGVCRET